MNGWKGKILRIDLSSGDVQTTPTSDYIDFLEENGVERMVLGLGFDSKEQVFETLQSYADATAAYRS